MMIEFYRAKKKIAERMRSVFDESSDRILDIGAGKNPWYHRIIAGTVTTFDTPKNKDHVDVTGSMEKLPFENESFDKVVSINALYFTTDPAKTFSEITRVLKRGGVAFLVTPFIHPIHDVPHDRYRFSEYTLVEFLREKCSSVSVTPVGGIFSLPLIFFRSIVKGASLAFPKTNGKVIQIAISVLLLPFLLIAQLLTLLDRFDTSRRMPIYYIVVAKKRL